MSSSEILSCIHKDFYFQIGPIHGAGMWGDYVGKGSFTPLQVTSVNLSHSLFLCIEHLPRMISVALCAQIVLVSSAVYSKHMLFLWFWGSA